MWVNKPLADFSARHIMQDTWGEKCFVMMLPLKIFDGTAQLLPCCVGKASELYLTIYLAVLFKVAAVRFDSFSPHILPRFA